MRDPKLQTAIAEVRSALAHSPVWSTVLDRARPASWGMTAQLAAGRAVAGGELLHVEGDIDQGGYRLVVVTGSHATILRIGGDAGTALEDDKRDVTVERFAISRLASVVATVIRERNGFEEYTDGLEAMTLTVRTEAGCELILADTMQGVRAIESRAALYETLLARLV